MESSKSTTLLSRKEVAKIFGVDPLSVKRWEKKNILQPVCRINGRPRYLGEDIEKLVNKGGEKK